MPLTRAFKETVRARIRQDRKYRKELLREGVECLLAGDLDTGKAILRDHTNATIGFEKAQPPHGAAGQEPDAHPRPQGEPAGAQPVRGDRPAPEDRGPALRAVAQGCKLGRRTTPQGGLPARSVDHFVAWARYPLDLGLTGGFRTWAVQPVGETPGREGGGGRALSG
jgi:hypothetical protein